MVATDLTALPTLATPRLYLRHLTAADVPALLTVFGDPRVMRYWSTPPLVDEDAAADLLAQIHAGFATRTLLQWGITRPDDRRVIGTCTLHAGQPLQNRRAEIGYALGSAAWGHGYAAEAVGRVITFAFAPVEAGGLGLHRLEADIDPRNAPSARVVERLGFQREGLLRERWIVNDEVCDTAFYGLLAREWRG